MHVHIRTCVIEIYGTWVECDIENIKIVRDKNIIMKNNILEQQKDNKYVIIIK